MSWPENPEPFVDRADAARQLAARLRGRPFRDLLVLAIPRGGVVTGAVLADELGGELDVVLSRKLRATGSPEYAVGAVSEDGRVVLNHDALRVVSMSREEVEAETAYQRAEIARRTRLIRAVRPAAVATGRSVVVTDDGIATGATMIAALQTVREHHPYELIAAAPVASPDRLAEVRQWCDEAVCLMAPADFRAVGAFYQNFDSVEDDQVIELLRRAADSPPR